MNRKFYRIVAMCLACVCVLSLNVNVVNAKDKLDSTDDLSAVAETFSADYVEPELSGHKILTRADMIEPDPYEPNNTIDEAYPYSRTTTLSGNEFIRGYKNSNMHIEGDEDFFYIYLDSGVTYDVILKNIYDEPRHIYLWKQNNDGTWTRWQKAVQNPGKPEHYHFTPSVWGKYYIQITGGAPEALYYFFCVEKVGTVNPAIWPGDVLG